MCWKCHSRIHSSITTVAALVCDINQSLVILSILLFNTQTTLITIVCQAILVGVNSLKSYLNTLYAKKLHFN